MRFHITTIRLPEETLHRVDNVIHDMKENPLLEGVRLGRSSVLRRAIKIGLQVIEGGREV